MNATIEYCAIFKLHSHVFLVMKSPVLVFEAPPRKPWKGQIKEEGWEKEKTSFTSEYVVACKVSKKEDVWFYFCLKKKGIGTTG